MPNGWKPKPGDRVIRHPRQEEIGPVRLTVSPRSVPSRALAFPLILMYAFAGLIAAGTLLLLAPFAHHGGGSTPFMEALFTATSAVTVTGLVIQDTATYWTRYGQVIILALMFIGGLGFMTFATFLLVIIGQRVTLTQRLLMRESLGVDQLGGLVRLTARIVMLAAIIQLAGFVILFIRFSFTYTPAEAVWQAVFHAVSGFNNAGFVVLPASESLSAVQGDVAVISMIAILAVLGGIGYWVIIDVVRSRRFSALTLNSKLVLILSGFLILAGALVFFAAEYDNPDTLGVMSVGQKAGLSLFESISGRTAGFSTVSFGDTEQHTNFFFTALMFIGGASASVAGGIKVNTLAVVLVAVLATIRGRQRATAFGREVPPQQVQRAMSVGAVATVLVFVMALLLTFSEADFPFIDILFESVSAFGTVGLSTGLTPDLSGWGHLILVLTMFAGRVGPLTVVLALAQAADRDVYRYARERVTIG